MDLQTAFDQGFAMLKTYVDGELGGLCARLAALEARPTLKYCGIWDGATDYVQGNFCTSDGSLWHAEQESRGVRPGDGRAWKLAVKRGGNR